MEKIFNYPFAKDGDRNTNIPEANAQDNSVSMQSGWTLPYELNPVNGGKYIERKDMNEILFRAFDGINQVAEAVDKWTRLTTENLNDIKQAGRYFQNLNNQATTANNYPTNNAGYLIVLNNSINTWGVTQIYKIWSSEKVFIRRTTSATAWSAWDSFVLTSEFNNKITSLQNTDTNLNNNKEDKTKFTNGIINATTNSNLDNLTTNGFYWRTANTGSPLPTANGGAVIVNTNRSQVIQYFYTDVWNLANGGAWFRTRNTGGTWTEWHHLENSEHAEATYRKIADSYTKTETNNLLNQKEDKTRISTQSLDDENLNDINISGFYRQRLDAKATTANNYPKTEAGTLIVLIPSGSGSTYLTQIYIVKDGTGIFTRARKNNLSWTDWEKLALKSEVDLKRNISDSYSKSEVYTKSQCDNTFLTKILASNTYRTIADSYSKSETDNLIIAGGYSRNNYTPNNISNATIPIPNKKVISGGAILVTCKYNATTNGTINTTFTFKIDGTSIATVTIEKVGNTGAGIGTFYAMRQTYFGLSGRLGKTIIPSLEDTGDIKLIDFSFLVVWQ